jgi:microcystin-dependent protein
MKIFLLTVGVLVCATAFSQNVGIGTTTPTAKLDVNGSLKSSSLVITAGGELSDFLIKSDMNGQVGFKKGHSGLGLNYIIAIQGAFPSENSPMAEGPLIGEIRLFSGNAAPFGWAFCRGQIMAVDTHPLLFALIGTTYGGNGTTTFQLPDLRNSVPVGEGTAWGLGQSSN